MKLKDITPDRLAAIMAPFMSAGMDSSSALLSALQLLNEATNVIDSLDEDGKLLHLFLSDGGKFFNIDEAMASAGFSRNSQTHFRDYLYSALCEFGYDKSEQEKYWEYVLGYHKRIDASGKEVEMRNRHISQRLLNKIIELKKLACDTRKNKAKAGKAAKAAARKKRVKKNKCRR